MRVALLATLFVASRKEPLAEMLQRIDEAFSGAGLGEPAIRFNFGDGPLGGRVSSVDRALKRHPELTRFVTSAVPLPLISGARRITNDSLSPAAGEAVPFATLHAIASGVPRSFPFHNINIHLHSPEFGELEPIREPPAERGTVPAAADVPPFCSRPSGDGARSAKGESPRRFSDRLLIPAAARAANDVGNSLER